MPDPGLCRVVAAIDGPSQHGDRGVRHSPGSICDPGLMNIDYFFTDFTEIRTFRTLTKPPLGSSIERYAEYLRVEGYSMPSAREHLRMLGRFNEWLEDQGRATEPVEPASFDGFRDYLREQGKLRNGYEYVLRHVLKMIHPNLCVCTPSPLELMLQGFREYLLDQRGLARTTVIDWSRLVQNFLEKQLPDSGSGDLSQIQPALIADWIKLQSGRSSAAYAKHIVTALRSFFSYTFYRGLTSRNLATCVPGAPSWSLVDLPRHLSSDQVQTVLDGCDPERRNGKRDFAILLLLARLGLRAGDVTAIKLEDIDWDAGLITVRGKTRRASQLPLPQEVGEAIADYLYRARPKCKSRHVFVRSRAPYGRFAELSSISAIATRALKDVGVSIGRYGSHIFRHSLATTMLKNGASLGEIGEILRHRRADTTRIYAKVDLPSLRALALPWPGGSR
jgi:integrase/recombinase XerD